MWFLVDLFLQSEFGEYLGRILRYVDPKIVVRVLDHDESIGFELNTHSEF